jgi:hypothetical protein
MHPQSINTSRQPVPGMDGKVKGFFGKLGGTLEKLRPEALGGAPGPKRELVLDMAAIERWPERLIRNARLNEAVTTFLKEVERKQGRIRQAKAALTDTRLRDKKVPERAFPIYDEHVPVIVKAVEMLLTSGFTDSPFLIEEQQEAFRQAITSYQEETRKSAAAIKEFLGPELAELGEGVRELEDTVIGLSGTLEQTKLANIKAVKQLAEEYVKSRPRELKLTEARTVIMKEVDTLEARKRKIKERIAYYTEQARNPKFKELIAEEEELLKKSDEVKVHGHPPEEEEKQLAPITSRLAFIRKQMINDITAMNINEQRSFLESVKDDLLLRKQKLERIDEALQQLSTDAFKLKVAGELEGLNARIEEANVLSGHEEV